MKKVDRNTTIPDWEEKDVQRKLTGALKTTRKGKRSRPEARRPVGLIIRNSRPRAALAGRRELLAHPPAVGPAQEDRTPSCRAASVQTATYWNPSTLVGPYAYCTLRPLFTDILAMSLVSCG